MPATAEMDTAPSKHTWALVPIRGQPQIAHTTETCTRPHTPRDRLLDTLQEQRQGASTCSCPREISPALGAYGLAHLQSPPALRTGRFCKAECFQDHLGPHPTCLLCLWEWGNKVS